jgi:hypothetical protein
MWESEECHCGYTKSPTNHSPAQDTLRGACSVGINAPKYSEPSRLGAMLRHEGRDATNYLCQLPAPMASHRVVCCGYGYRFVVVSLLVGLVARIEDTGAQRVKQVSLVLLCTALISGLTASLMCDNQSPYILDPGVPSHMRAQALHTCGGDGDAHCDIMDAHGASLCHVVNA